MSDSQDLMTEYLMNLVVSQQEALNSAMRIIEKLIGEEEVPVEEVADEHEHDFYAGVCRICGALPYLGG